MKRAIEYKENVEVMHQVIVEVDDEDTLDTICNITGDSFGEILDKISDEPGVKILESNEEYCVDSDEPIEYYDDYWTDNEAGRFPD